jgi:uncharacterized protein YndB with AHSA1/START domain
MKPASDAPSLRYVRRIRASADDVFQAFVDPRVIMHWWGPDEGPTLSAETDVRVGGRFKVAFRTMDGIHHETNGEYLELDPPRRLVMRWWWADAPDLRTRVTVAIEPVDGGAQVTLVHEGFVDVETRDSHEAGWKVALEKMAVRIERAHEEERS